MNAAEYQKQLRAAEKSLGVYRDEFRRTRVRLANIYVRIEQLQKSFDNGDFTFTTVIQTKNGEQEVIDPHMLELDNLNSQALTFEKALGLTADSAKKIRPELFGDTEEKKDPFASLFQQAQNRSAV